MPTSFSSNRVSPSLICRSRKRHNGITVGNASSWNLTSNLMSGFRFYGTRSEPQASYRSAFLCSPRQSRAIQNQERDYHLSNLFPHEERFQDADPYWRRLLAVNWDLPDAVDYSLNTVINRIELSPVLTLAAILSFVTCTRTLLPPKALLW